MDPGRSLNVKARDGGAGPRAAGNSAEGSGWVLCSIHREGLTRRLARGAAARTAPCPRSGPQASRPETRLQRLRRTWWVPGLEFSGGFSAVTSSAQATRKDTAKDVKKPTDGGDLKTGWTSCPHTKNLTARQQKPQRFRTGRGVWADVLGRRCTDGGRPTAGLTARLPEKRELEPVRRR